MTTLPQEAVKAACDAYKLEDGRLSGIGMMRALEAAAPHLSAVRVKKLEWKKYRNGDAETLTIFGEIYTAYANGYWRITRNGKAGKFIKATGGDDVLAAKAAAQADYSARILSALEPSAARSLALEEAARNAAMYLATGFITCPRCGEEVETKDTDAEYTLRAALSSPDHADDLAVDRFAIAMKQKLAKKREEGRGGWENKDECSAEYLSYLLIQHIWKGDPVDIATLAMMLQQRGERVVIDSETSSIIPDHIADAGKLVEGDGWSPIESAPDHEQGPFLVTNNPKAVNAFGRPSHVWCVDSIHVDDDGSFCAFHGYQKIHDLKMFAIVSAPASEGAE